MSVLPRPSAIDATALALIGLVVACVYATTLCPTVWWYDSAEFAAHAVSLTAPHPPGYPLYTVLAHAFTHLGPEPAFGVNVMSAVFGVVGVLVFYVVGRQIGLTASAATIASLGLAATPVYWSNATVAEVYTPGLSFTLATLSLLLLGQRRARRWAIPCAALVAGLGLGVHMSIATCGLGYLALVASSGLAEDAPSRPSSRWTHDVRARLATALACIPAVLLGASSYAWFPLLAFADPSDPQAWRHWGDVIAGGLFTGLFAEHYATMTFVDRVVQVLLHEVGATTLVLAVIGCVWLAKYRAWIFTALALMALGNVWFFFNYRVHDIEVFFLPSIAVVYLLAGAGAQAFVELALALVATLPSRIRTAMRELALLPFLSLPIQRAVADYRERDMSDRTAAQDYAKRLITEVPGRAVFVKWNEVGEWKHYAVLLYVQRALGLRNDVRVSTRPSSTRIAALLAHGRPVLAFQPTPRIRRDFTIASSGIIHAITGIRDKN